MVTKCFNCQQKYSEQANINIIVHLYFCHFCFRALKDNQVIRRFSSLKQAQGLDDGIFWKHETLSTIIDYEMLLV